MVKSLHAIDEIAARIRQSDGNGVRLSPERKASGGSGVDPVAAIRSALEEPLDYPPLAAGIVPGDRVAIAVDSDVPCVASVVRGAIEALRHAGVELQEVAIVTTDAETSQRCRDELGGNEGGPQFVVHDPASENDLCNVGMTKRGQTVLVNRTIFDADLVLPIGCARAGRDNAYASLFPQFSNAETVERYRTPAQHDAIVNYKGRRSEADQAGWMIGVPMTVQVVPGPNESVASVVAGEPQAVAKRCEELCRAQWENQSPQKVSLLVATVTGGEASQTWANVGRALAVAESVVEEDGAVVLCTNLAEPPGRSLGRLIGGPDLDVARRKISHDHEPDTWPAWHLARALQRGPVYLLSQLSSETVEDLGIAPVESVDDLVRLAGRRESFLVIEDAQHALVTIDGVSDDE